MVNKTCPMTSILELLSKKWSLLILHLLYADKKKRFSELSNEIERINPRILSQRLKELEKEGLIVKKKYKEIPPKSEYSLTPKGKDLWSHFNHLNKWIIKWK